MTLPSILFMVLVLAVVWGGLAFLLCVALRKEREKGKDHKEFGGAY